MAYDAQTAAALPISDLALEVLAHTHATQTVPLRHCAAYLQAVQSMPWFHAAFTAHGHPLIVSGGKGLSHADGTAWRMKIGTDDRRDVRRCEQACLHELAHLVTNDYGIEGERREPVDGADSSRGHHHAWRANFVLIVRMVLGRQAASRLRHEFNQWGLPTSR